MPFDRPRVLRVLARIAADLDALARRSLESAEERRQSGGASHTASSAARRARAAAATTEPVGERATSRQALGLPPYERS